MKLLLDTHTFLWMNAEPTKLSATASSLIVDPGNAVGTATVSPHDHLPASDALLFYQVDDGAGIPGLIKLTKGGLGVMILF